MNTRQKYRIFVCCLLAVSVVALGCVSWAAFYSAIPDRLVVAEAGEQPELFPYPWNLLVEETVALREKRGAEKSGAGSDMMGEAYREGYKDVQNPDGDMQITEEAISGQNQQAVQAVERDDIRQKEAGSASGWEHPSSAAAGTSDYEITYSLFGKIPLKTVSASVVKPAQVYAGGTPVGIYLRTNGVLVVDTGAIQASDGTKCCPAENIVRSGDYIKSVNGEALSTKEELVACIGSSGGADVILAVERDGEDIELKVSPVLDENGIYRAGIWVRNDTQGIGTLTYIDEEGHFGALGHGISDVDTGALMEIDDGVLYDAEVISIVKGKQGTPGELAGVIHYSEGYKVGVIEENRQNGIYGTMSGFPLLAERMTRYEVAYRQSVETGPATILCSVDGVCREYQVKIEEIRLNGEDVNKGMVLRVTDPELLELTGGIVQGMGVMYNRDNTGNAVFMRVSGFDLFH